MDEKVQSNEKLIKEITIRVIKKMQRLQRSAVIGVSNRHVHLSRDDMDKLFGVNSQLTKLRDLLQPGQYACEETVDIKGLKGKIEKVRVLGPLRSETQVEISTGDSFILGLKVPIKESGKLDNTPGVELIGPKGRVQKMSGTIVAFRHIHMSLEDAKNLNLSDGDTVDVEIGKERGAILRNVLIRAKKDFKMEMHIDIEEANALGVKNGDLGFIL